ncbi:hypothetical protein J437_LFUL016758, partial [Ladona fulva]
MRFTPSATGWTAVTDVTFTELRNDKGVLVAKELPREALRYYTSCLFWLRVIGLKAQLGDQLTQTEVDVQRTFTNQVLSVPEPIHIGLKALGRTKTKNGEIISPEFPSLPDTVTANTPGGLGPVNTENHSVYEDLPIIGPAYQACYERAADARVVNYDSAFQPPHGVANPNLQGFGPLTPARMEAIGLLNEMGFSLDERPVTIGNSGINYNAVKTVSNLISRIIRFKMVEVDILSMPPTGSIAQVIQSRPVAQDLQNITRATQVTMSPQCASNESKMHLGICDSFMKTMNVRIYPGAVHDQFIWNYCPVKRMTKATHDERQGRFYLLGDSGYALEPWLLTPLPHAEAGTPEYRYSQAHCRARNVVERLFGVLKGRWRCLLREMVLHYQPERAAKIVLACAVLHNIILHHRLPLPEIEFYVEDD